MRHRVGKQHEEILASGVSALVTKPVDMDEILETLRRFLPPSAQSGIVLETGR